MRVLMTTQPGLGHWHPLVPLAHALQRAGCEVAVACAQSFIPYVRASGVHAFAAGLDWLESDAETAFPEMKGMSFGEKDAYLFEIFADTTANQMTADVLELCKTWQPDVIVREQFEYGGCVAAECLGLPHVAVGMELFLPEVVTRQRLEQPLAYVRSAYGLPPYPAVEMLTRYLYLSHIPPSYNWQGISLPATVQAIQPAFFMQSGNETLPDWVLQLPARPTVYVSMGTVFNQVPEIFKIIIEGLGGESLNVIITVGRSMDPHQLGPTPANVHVAQYIPQTALMPYCQASITNGGAGTTLASLCSGVPVLIVPPAFSMTCHAMRCQALGVGAMLCPPWYKSARDFIHDLNLYVPETFARSVSAAWFARLPALLSPQSVRETIWAMLTEPVYRQALQRLQAEIEALPTLDDAVELIGELVNRHKKGEK